MHISRADIRHLEWLSITIQIYCIPCQHNLQLWISHISQSQIYQQSASHIILHSLDSLSSIYCWRLFGKEYQVIKKYYCTFLDSLSSMYCQRFCKEYQSKQILLYCLSGCCLAGVLVFLLTIAVYCAPSQLTSASGYEVQWVWQWVWCGESLQPKERTH